LDVPGVSTLALAILPHEAFLRPLGAPPTSEVFGPLEGADAMAFAGHYRPL